MTIQFCSDLHLEFPENKDYLKTHLLDPVGDILVLAGDVVPFGLLERERAFFDFCSDHFRMTYWLPGNHEYYGSDIAERSGHLEESIRENVHLVNQVTVFQEGVRLVFSSLWSRIPPGHALEIEGRLNDFRMIKFRGNRFTPEVYNQFHEQNREFLRKVITANHQGPTLVVSHHVPTFFHYPAQYQGEILNEAFASELYDFIEGSTVDYWIFGHHHCNIADFRIGKTLLVTNQVGYVRYGEQSGFKNNRTIPF